MRPYLDMMNENREFISYLEFKNKIGTHASNLTDYVTIKLAINKIKDKIDLKDENINILLNQQKSENLTRKYIYNFFIEEKRCHCETMWERKMGKTLHEKTWSNIFLSTKETKLQEIQWKIVHNIFPTNILLTRIGIKSSEKCELCGVTEYIEHLFIECQRIGSFWEKVERLILSQINKSIKLNNNIILLGIEQDKQFEKLKLKEMYQINEILIIGKLSISKSKVNNLNLDLVFERELRIRSKIN